MKLNASNFIIGELLLLGVPACAIIGKTIYDLKKNESELENIKTEIMENDPERYARTMEKAGSMTDTESKTFVWKEAFKEMNDSLRDAASEASTNYVLGTMVK